MRFFFAQDDSCHWYIVEASEKDAWAAWANQDPHPGDEPPAHVAERINGPISAITFTDPKEDTDGQ